jgi:CyaY protein
MAKDFITTLYEAAMTDTEYLNAAESLLRAIELSCDRLNDETDADIDNQRVGGMITITFANKSQIIINLQKPLHEVWMAAKAGGYHYKMDASSGAWRCTREGTEFFSDLSRHATSQSGSSLLFSA